MPHRCLQWGRLRTRQPGIRWETGRQPGTEAGMLEQRETAAYPGGPVNADIPITAVNSVWNAEVPNLPKQAGPAPAVPLTRGNSVPTAAPEGRKAHRYTDVTNAGGNPKILPILRSSVQNAGMSLMNVTECSSERKFAAMPAC